MAILLQQIGSEPLNLGLLRSTSLLIKMGLLMDVL